MKDLDAAYQTHIELPLSTLAYTLRVEMVNAPNTVVCATSLDAALTVGGEDFLPFGFNRQDVTASGDMDVGTSEVTSILDSDLITEEDVLDGRWDYASYEFRRVNWAAPSVPGEIMMEGSVGTFRTGRVQFVAELLGKMQAVQNGIGVLNSSQCIHELGDHDDSPGRGNGCTVDLASFSVTGTMDGLHDADLYQPIDSARTEPDATYGGGILTFTSGVMTGLRYKVRAYVVGRLVLFTALIASPTGAAYTLSRGCDKSLATCRDVFGKASTDRLASDYTQGNDIAVQAARHNG